MDLLESTIFIPSGGLEIVPHRVCRNLWGWERREAAEARGTVLQAAGERAGRPARALDRRYYRTMLLLLLLLFLFHLALLFPSESKHKR